MFKSEVKKGTSYGYQRMTQVFILFFCLWNSEYLDNTGKNAQSKTLF